MTVKFNQALLLEEKRPPVLLEARHLYKKIIEISPQYVDAYARIARQDFKRGPADTALQDARYVIDTITFFAVSSPENSAFFRKNRQIFENILRKLLHILNILEKCCILEKSRKKIG